MTFAGNKCLLMKDSLNGNENWEWHIHILNKTKTEIEIAHHIIEFTLKFSSYFRTSKNYYFIKNQLKVSIISNPVIIKITIRRWLHTILWIIKIHYASFIIT